jgi:UMF1 family MFS transporter
MYDWANSAFATTVIAGFFPIFFKEYWSAGLSVTESTFLLSLSVSSAGLLVALCAPLLGAIADRGSARKRFLLLSTGIGVFASGGLYLVAQGNWQAAWILYALGTVGFLTAQVFYDSLLVSVAPATDVDRVSSQGYALGYLGGGLLFLFNVIAVLQPQWFGFADSSTAVRFSFLSVALWWAVFSIPLIRNVKEPYPGPPVGIRESVRDGVRTLLATLARIRIYRPVVLFLIAYWFYIDGVDTVVAMAVDYGLSIGFQRDELITALLLVQFVGVPFALLMGFLGQRWGTRKTILLCLGIYLAVTFLGARLDLEAYSLFGVKISKFYFLAILVATAQGGIQALSRSYYSRIIWILQHAGEVCGDHRPAAGWRGGKDNGGSAPGNPIAGLAVHHWGSCVARCPHSGKRHRPGPIPGSDRELNRRRQ